MTKLPSITGAIFCGGASSRMGVPKAGIIFPDGRTMIELVYDALKEVCSQVVLVGHGEGVPHRLKDLIRLDDRYLFCGPMGGLETLLTSNIDKEYLITPCDLAWVTSSVYECLLSENIQAPAVLKHDDQLEHLIARYSVKELPIVQWLLKKKLLAMHHLTDIAQSQLVEAPVHLHAALHNANSPRDLL